MSKFLNTSYRNILMLLFSVLIGFSSCGDETLDDLGEFDLSQAESFQLGDTAIVVSGKWTTIDNGKVGIELAEIIDDSRCPTEELILCVWEGQVSFKINILIVGESTVYSHLISTADSQTHKVLFGGYQVQFVAVKPEKRTQEPIDFENYEVKMIITK